jgi:hypothetical protein
MQHGVEVQGNHRHARRHQMHEQTIVGEFARRVVVRQEKVNAVLLRRVLRRILCRILCRFLRCRTGMGRMRLRLRCVCRVCVLRGVCRVCVLRCVCRVCVLLQSRS